MIGVFIIGCEAHVALRLGASLIDSLGAMHIHDRSQTRPKDASPSAALVSPVRIRSLQQQFVLIQPRERNLHGCDLFYENIATHFLTTLQLQLTLLCQPLLWLTWPVAPQIPL